MARRTKLVSEAAREFYLPKALAVRIAITMLPIVVAGCIPYSKTTDEVRIAHSESDVAGCVYVDSFQLTTSGEQLDLGYVNPALLAQVMQTVQWRVEPISEREELAARNFSVRRTNANRLLPDTQVFLTRRWRQYRCPTALK